MRQCPDGYARTCEALADAQPADVGAITCPTLLVTGDEDAVAPAQSVRQLGGRIRRRARGGAGALRALDPDREAGGVRGPAEALLRPAHVRRSEP